MRWPVAFLFALAVNIVVLMLLDLAVRAAS